MDFAAQTDGDSGTQECPELGQLANLGTAVTPLFPVAHAYPAAQPLVDFGYGV